jgi:hypothetical protein
MLDYIIFVAAAIAGVALFFVGDALPALLPRRVSYALLAIIMGALAIYLLARAYSTP